MSELQKCVTFFKSLSSLVVKGHKIPVLAVVPPGGASPPSSPSASDSPPVSVCGPGASSDTPLHKSESADTRHHRDTKSKTYLGCVDTVVSPPSTAIVCQSVPRAATWRRYLPSVSSPLLSIKQIFPWQQ